MNEKYSLTLGDDDQRKRCEEYEEEATEEHRLVVERVVAHLKERAGEVPSVPTEARSSTSSRAAAHHASRMAEIEDKVCDMELKQLQNRQQKEEEEQRLHRE